MEGEWTNKNDPQAFSTRHDTRFDRTTSDGLAEPELRMCDQQDSPKAFFESFWNHQLRALKRHVESGGPFEDERYDPPGRR